MENVKIAFVTKRRGTIYVLELIIFLCFYLLVTRFSYTTSNRYLSMLVLSIIIAYHYLSWKKEKKIRQKILIECNTALYLKNKKQCIMLVIKEKGIFIDCSATNKDFDYFYLTNMAACFIYYIFPILYGFSFILFYHGMMFWDINLFHYGLLIMGIAGIFLNQNHTMYQKLNTITNVYEKTK